MSLPMLPILTSFKGEVAALCAAAIWAIASFIYVGLGKRLPPLLLNFAKTGIAIGLIGLTLLLRGDQLPPIPALGLGLLLLSGVIGIGFGDTAFFEALNCIGVRRSLLLEALSPALAALLAAILLQEQLGVSACLGIALTLVGVAWVVVDRAPDQVQGAWRPLRGILFGLLAALAQAGGAVMSRAALVDTGISPLWSTLIRLIGGILVVLIGMGWQRRWRELLTLPRSFLPVLVLTSFAGTYVAMWLQQTALKYTQTGIAQSLTATSPLFVIPLAVASGERISVRAILGVLVALAGIWLLFGRV